MSSENNWNSMDRLLERARFSVDSALRDKKDHDQSFEQIFENGKGFAVITLFRNGYGNERILGNGILIARYKNIFSFPLGINLYHSSPNATLFGDEPSVINAGNSESSDYFLVFKDFGTLSHLIDKSEIVLGMDSPLLSTTNAARIQEHANGILVYRLVPSHGLQLISSLDDFKNIRIKYDNNINNNFYGNKFDIKKLLYGDIKLDENYDNYDKLIENVSNHFVSLDKSNLSQKILEKAQDIKENLMSTMENIKEKVSGKPSNVQDY